MGYPRKPSKSTEQNWIRTGGFIGDDSMSLIDKYNAEGCGVDESDIRDFDRNPNEKRLPTRKGAED